MKINLLQQAAAHHLKAGKLFIIADIALAMSAALGDNQ
jgi:hypothetical protein